MATVFKTFLNNDIKSTRTLLHEAIPLTGSIVSGTYGDQTIAQGSEPNIKNYAHGMFQSVYDYPYLSSSANHIFDLTVGYSTASDSLSASSNTQNAKKVNIYNTMAATLMGYDASGSILLFDEDGDLAGTKTDKINDAIFINFARLLQKDEIKKGSFTMKLGSGSSFIAANGGATASLLTISDTGSSTTYKVNSAAGEFGILYANSGDTNGMANTATGKSNKTGLIFYQAGVVVLTASVFMGGATGSMRHNAMMSPVGTGNGAANMSGSLTGTSILGCCDAFRHRIYDISFNNTTELNSTIHFCRINSSDFNYTSNPSYLSQSQIVVKNSQMDAPISYMTTVGLYSADNELLAVAKLSEPLKKDPTNEMTLRVRLDY